MEQKCARCGEHLPDGSERCGFCGQFVDAEFQATLSRPPWKKTWLFINRSYYVDNFQDEDGYLEIESLDLTQHVRRRINRKDWLLQNNALIVFLTIFTTIGALLVIGGSFFGWLMLMASAPALLFALSLLFWVSYLPPYSWRGRRSN